MRKPKQDGFVFSKYFVKVLALEYRGRNRYYYIKSNDIELLYFTLKMKSSLLSFHVAAGVLHIK